MLTVALFTRARTRTQPRCPLTDEWIKKIWYTYTMEYESAIKKSEIMPFAAARMDLEIITLSGLNETSAIWYHLYVEFKIRHKSTYLQNRNRLTESRLMVAKGEER